MEFPFENVLHFKKINYDIVMKRRQLAELRKKVGVLVSEAVKHQQNLIKDSADQRILVPNTMVDLKDSYLTAMNERHEAQQAISLSGLSQVRVDVERMAGFSEDAATQQQQEELEEMETDKAEQGVFKVYETEGKIGDTAYAATFQVKNDPDEKHEKVTEMKDLRLATHDPVPKKMITPERITLADTVHSFTADLFYHKVLLEERSEALSHLQSELADVEVVGHMEPVVLRLQSQGEHQVEVLWELAWDEDNGRFKYNISVACTEEVAARYSTSDVYPYLSGQEKLLTPRDVISFAERFSNL